MQWIGAECKYSNGLPPLLTKHLPIAHSKVAKHAQPLRRYRFVIDFYTLKSWSIKPVQEAVGSRRTLHEGCRIALYTREIFVND